MNYIYHLFLEDMKGQILYPLNVLKNKYPSIYKKEAEKYSNERKKVMKRKIPFINCLMSDVLHFTTVHPSKIAKALKEAGYPLKKSKWLKINSKKIDSTKAIIYLFSFKKKESEFMAEDNFVEFNGKNLSEYNKIPARTKRYYKKEIRSGRRPLKFLFIPHVFYKANLNIKGVEIIEA